MKKIKYLIILLLLFFSAFVINTIPTQATNINDVISGLDQTATEAKITKDVTLFGITGDFIFLLLGILGSLFLILTIYGGITWMTAAGNEEKISKARSTVVHAVIGLIIVLAAYLLTNFIIFQLSDNLTTGYTEPAVAENADQPCLDLGGICEYNATAGNLCNNDNGTYVTGKCLSNPSSTYLCCVPNQ